MTWARCDETVAAGHNMNWVVMMRTILIAIWCCQGKWWFGHRMMMGWVVGEWI